MAPRATVRLSSTAKQSLAGFRMAFERAATWCRESLLVVIAMLPKPQGGLRPIGLLPFENRVWSRVRS